MTNKDEPILIKRPDLGENTYTLVAAGDPIPADLAGMDTVPAAGLMAKSDPPNVSGPLAHEAAPATVTGRLRRGKQDNY